VVQRYNWIYPTYFTATKSSLEELLEKTKKIVEYRSIFYYDRRAIKKIGGISLFYIIL
jgi:hypothetical protein